MTLFFFLLSLFSVIRYYGSRDEPSDPIITCPIRNRKNLEESLDAFYSEEEIDGLKWDKKGGAAGEEIALLTKRRLTIKTLPQTLIMYGIRKGLN